MRILTPYHVSIVVAGGLLAAPGGGAQPHQQQQQPEYLIKARYLLALADYVTWPAGVDLGENGRALVLGILGTSPFDLQRNEIFQSRQVKGRHLTIRYLKSYRDAEACDILFIGESESGHLQDLLKMLKSRPILTIADTPDFARRGVMINLFEEQARVLFEINLASVRASGLEVGSRVLKLAKMIDQ